MQINPAINFGPNVNQFQAAGAGGAQGFGGIGGFGGINQGQNAFIGGNPNAFGLGGNPNGLGLGLGNPNAFGLGAEGAVVGVDAAAVDVVPGKVGVCESLDSSNSLSPSPPLPPFAP